MVTATVDVFGTSVKYDFNKVYGVFNSQGQYGILPVETHVPKLVAAGKADKSGLKKHLEDQATVLKKHLDGETILDALGTECILETSPPNVRKRAEIQNTIDLFERMAKAIPA